MRATGLDLHFAPQEQNRGVAAVETGGKQRSPAPHLIGFESCFILRKYKRGGLLPPLLYLVRATGLEPARFWQWNLRVMSPQ